jgi:hypothetical protein
MEVRDECRPACTPEVAMSNVTTHRPPPPHSFVERLDEWVGAGLISADQAASIREHEAARPVRTHPARPAGPSLVVEALGYLGGVIMIVGAGILVSLYWGDLPVAGRLALLAATAVVLVGAGFGVPERLGEAAGRLRSVVWAAGVVATGAFLVVFCGDVLDRYDEQQLWILGGGAGAVAAVLWWLHRTWLQQLALLVPLLLLVAGVALDVATDDAWAGAWVWAAGLVWTVAAWRGVLEPRVTGVAFGVVGAVFGTLTMGNDLGLALGLATAVATVALALEERDLTWLGVAALVLLYTTPRAAGQWFPGRLSAALTFLVTGALLVGAAVWVARHRREEPPGPA